MPISFPIPNIYSKKKRIRKNGIDKDILDNNLIINILICSLFLFFVFLFSLPSRFKVLIELLDLSNCANFFVPSSPIPVFLISNEFNFNYFEF